MKKVYLLSNSYLPEFGGLVSYLHNVSGILKSEYKSKYDVEIITLTNKDLNPTEIINGVKVNRVNFKKKFIFQYLFSPFNTVNKIKSFFNSHIEKDALFITRHFYFAYILGKLYPENSIYLVPVIAPKLQKIHESQVKWIKKIYFKIISPQIHYIEKKAITSGMNIAVLSESKRSELSDFYNVPRDRIIVVPPGVDIKRFRPIKSTDEKNKILKKISRTNDENKFLLLSVCRLSKEKNLQLLINTMDKLRHENVILYIVGSGDIELELKQQVINKGLQDHIIFFGQRSDVEDFYRIANLFILPSVYEGFGHVFLEALSSGTPCIGLKSSPPNVITATDEIINNNLNGFIISNNSQELTDVVKQNLIQINALLKMREHSREVILEKFTWNKHINTILHILGEKIDSN